jgi:hypothetical protein
MLVEVLLLLKLFQFREVTMPLIIAIVIFGILLFLAPRQILNIKLKYPLSELEYRTDQLNENIKNLVMASMSDEMYTQLKLIEDGKSKPAEMKESFRRELKYLDVLGYIKFTDGSLSELNNGKTDDMNKKAEVTDLGSNYIRLRESCK